MRKIFTLALTAMLMGGVNVSAQTEYTILQDLTASKVQNANFAEGEPVTVTIRTYDYDMADVPVGESDPTLGLFGMQAVPGWTASAPSDNIRMEKDERTDGTNAKAAGLFVYDDETGEQEYPGLGGTYYAPYAPDAEATGNVLGMVAVWGAEAKYTQDVTLNAGAYMMVVRLYNAAGAGTLGANYMGFITSDASYTSTKETYAEGVWETDTIVFRLTAATEGQLSLGLRFGAGSGSAPHLFVSDVKLYSIDEQQLIQAEIDKAKEELKALIDEGDIYGADVTESKAVYNNANATMEQVQAAIAAQKEINAASLTDLSEYFFNNPHFDEDEPVVGGICTYDYDCEQNGISTTNYSMLPVTSWERMKTDNGAASGVFAIGSGAWVGGKDYVVPTELSNGSKEGKVLGFVTCWSMAVQYKQACTLPAGQYKLTMSYYNTGGTTAIAKNLIGFVANDGTEYLATATTFPVGKWTSEEVSFILDEETTGYFSLGYQSQNVGSASMPHFFTDGISLTYVGTGFNPSLFALQSAIKTGETWVESEEVYNAALRSQMEAAVETAQALYDDESNDTEANKAAAAVIKDLVPQIEASVAAYKSLAALQTELENSIEEYGEETYPTLNERLGTLKDGVDAALEEQNWDNAQIEEAIAQRPVIIKEEIQKIFDAAVESGEATAENINITPLYEQMAYTYSTSAQTGANVPDKEWQYGNAGNFKTQYGTAEVWNQSPFAVSRTLKDMPAGTYTLTTKAFYRTADNATNYDNYDAENELAFVFAGNNKTALTNVAVIASDNNEGKTGWAETAEGSGIYVPNSQEAGYNVFNDEAYDAVVTKSVSTVLTETGDLTFGVKADQLEGNSWVLWYSFSIAYNAIDADVLNSDLQGLITEFHNYCEEQEENMNNYEAGFSSDAEAAATAAIGGDVETLDAARKALAAAYEEVKAGVEAWAAYNAATESFYTAKDEYYDEASVEAQNAYDAVAELVDAEAAAEYNAAEVNALIDQMGTVASALKLPADYSAASDENPIVMTQVIINPSFEDGLNGWAYYQGSDTKSADNSNATYTIDIADGSYVFNTWNSSTPADGYYVSQVLKGLPAGTYELQAILASDLGSKIDLTANGEGMPFEMEGAKEYGQEASIIFKLEEKGDVTIKASSMSWFKADNFRLAYYGAESTKEVTGIEETEIATAPAKGLMYNLAGQQVDKSYKGIVLKDGKVYLQK